MSYTINFIGHCFTHNHDKVWGYLTASDGHIYNFWGKRNAKFTFQQHEGTWKDNRDFERKARNKCKPGRSSGTYIEVAPDKVDTIWPGFVRDLEHQLVFAKLADNFR